MNISIEVTNPEEWKKHFPPAGGDKQWRDGYSALEFAKIVTDSYKDISFEELLRKELHIPDLSIIPGELYPERLSVFDDDYHGPRHHDLACIAETKGKKIALCFEAKVFEPLDKQLEKYVLESEGKRKRCQTLCNRFFNENYNTKFKEIYYQLLSSVAGTIAFASENGINEAYFILFQIKPRENNQCRNPTEKIEEHKKALNDFLQCIPTSDKTEIKKSGSVRKLGNSISIERKKNGKEMSAKVYISYIEIEVSGEHIDC